MEPKTHSRCKLPTNLYETFDIYSKRKRRNYDSHEITHIAKIDHYFIKICAKTFFAKLRIISFIQGNGKSEIRPRSKQSTANIIAIHLPLNSPNSLGTRCSHSLVLPSLTGRLGLAETFDRGQSLRHIKALSKITECKAVPTIGKHIIRQQNFNLCSQFPNSSAKPLETMAKC